MDGEILNRFGDGSLGNNCVVAMGAASDKGEIEQQLIGTLNVVDEFSVLRTIKPPVNRRRVS